MRTEDDQAGIEKFVELEQFTVDENSVQLLTYKFCIQKHAVILGTVNLDAPESITVGILDPDDAELIRSIEEILHRPVNPVKLNAYEIKKAINIGFKSAVQTDEKLKLNLQYIKSLSFKSDISPPQVLDEVIGLAISLDASDIHIECYNDDVDVRFRIDGILHQINTQITVETIAPIISRLKILADLDIAERFMSQDGRILAVFKDGEKTRPIDLRLSILPGYHKEDAVLRILDSEMPLIGLEKLGLAKYNLKRFRILINNPEGMILVTGPTGSGKTTTLYSALQEINTDENKVLTAEDPIEYFFNKINQKQVSVHMNFADYARAFMRHDPDIIMIGEVRDEETADVALRAAQTGHLVLSTLHTNDSVSTVARLRTLGLKSGHISDSLLCVLSQRLVRKVCENCTTELIPDKFAKKIFKKLGSSFPLFHGKGCSKCYNSGYKGRLGIFEFFIADQKISDMIAEETPSHKIRKYTHEHGMFTLMEDALGKVKSGNTTLSEVRYVVPYRIMEEPLINIEHLIDQKLRKQYKK